SDVSDDDLATIGSGPAVADLTTYADAEAALARYRAPGDGLDRIAAHLAAGRAGRHPETAKPGDPALRHVRATVIGANRDARDAAASEAARRGYVVRRIDDPLAGDARAVGARLANVLLAERRDARVAVIAGGETTVRAMAGGLGGRCQ